MRTKTKVLEMELKFELGTVVTSASVAGELDGMNWDKRSSNWRAPAYRYRDIITAANRKSLACVDGARQYKTLELQIKRSIEPREHQAAAMMQWLNSGGTGCICLPTGAGKTILAMMLIQKVQRSTLIVVPTIDLMHQWVSVLEDFFDVPIGSYGGGQKDLQDITVMTYDSAALMIESLGGSFGFLVCDEVHHLPAPQYRLVAEGCIAPFRLGLSATLERSDGGEQLIYEIIGPLRYEAQITEMVDDVLSPYRVVSLEIPLSDEEKRMYDEAREEYLSFARRVGVNFGSPRGWMDFVLKCSRMPGGKAAMTAYRRQKDLAQRSHGKLTKIWQLLLDHREDRIIIFTDKNDFAYEIGNRYLLPVITHHTKLKERRELLQAFRNGEFSALVTSKVLNEGVDVPEAGIGIVVSGSGAVREHVQRLGRILRHRPGKQAVLYELISQGTGERFVNYRRRQHHAYQRHDEVPH